jgi:hypothetical protein
VKPPVFMCDRKIHEQIVSPLPDRPFFLAIIGSAGTGNTIMMINLLPNKQANRRAFHAVHVVMPPHNVTSRKLVVVIVFSPLPRIEGQAYARWRVVTGGAAIISDEGVRGSSRGL